MSIPLMSVETDSSSLSDFPDVAGGVVFLARRCRFAGFGLSGENLSVFFTFSRERRFLPRDFGDVFFVVPGW